MHIDDNFLVKNPGIWGKVMKIFQPTVEQISGVFLEHQQYLTRNTQIVKQTKLDPPIENEV